MCTLQNTQMLSSMDQQLYTAIADFCHFPNRILFVYQGREPGLICTRETKRPRSDLSAASTSAHLQWVQTIWTTKPISIKQHPDDVWMKHWHHRLYWRGLITKHVGGFFGKKVILSSWTSHVIWSRAEDCGYCRLWIISSLAMRCVVLLTRDMRELSLWDQSFSRSLGSLGLWKLMMPASRSTLA